MAVASWASPTSTFWLLTSFLSLIFPVSVSLGSVLHYGPLFENFLLRMTDLDISWTLRFYLSCINGMRDFLKTEELFF